MYDWAPAISMMAVYAIFLAEIVAYRVGTNYMAKITGNPNAYGMFTSLPRTPMYS
jgi:zinc transporter 1/2/3